MTGRSLAPLAPGDLLVTATRLHAGHRVPTGDGAVRQYRADLSFRGEAETGGVGLVAHVALDGSGRLWALDPLARAIARFDRDGQPLAPPPVGDHPFGPMLVLPGGDILLGEHLAAPSGPFAGRGRVCRLGSGLTPVAWYETAWNGGIGGFLGVTHMALSPDAAVLYHLTETGPHLYGHDLAADRPLGALFTREREPGMLFGLAAVPGGDLLVADGWRLLRLRPRGAGLACVSEIALPPPEGSRPGWSNVVLRPSGQSVFALDFRGGRLAEVALASEQVLRCAALGLPSALASLVEVP